MIIRDRGLEKRAESENIRTLWKTDPAEEFTILSSDLNNINLKEDNSDYANPTNYGKPRTIAEESSQHMTFDIRPETHEDHKNPNGPFPEKISALKLADQGCSIVDLISDDPTKGTWKQTIIKRFCEEEDSKDPSLLENTTIDCFRDLPIKMTESLIKSHRDGGSSGLTTALKDRAPCVIPLQPNHSLPIRPIPPAPTRSSAISKTLILKLSKPLRVSNVDEHSGNSISVKIKSDQDLKNGKRVQRSTDINAAAFESPSTGMKRKLNERTDAEKYAVKDSRKRRKSQETDSSPSKEDRHKEILPDCSLKHQNNEANKNRTVIRESAKEQSQGLSSGDPNEDFLEKEREENKTVPPLRLKKIVREAAEIESNYRIVTDAPPVPSTATMEITGAISTWSTTKSKSDETYHDPLDDFQQPQNKSPHVGAAKNDGFKVKCRRNRLKQKLRELRNKRQTLDEEMSRVQKDNPQQTTRLRQMMNCNEKQIENLMKLLDKLSTPATTVESANKTEESVLNVNQENAVSNTEEKVGQTEPSSQECQINSPEYETVSPEPPKLSPSSPLDYEQKKSPCEMRNSPPVLAMICLAIPPNLKSTFETEIPTAKENTWKTSHPAALSIPFALPEEEIQSLPTAKVDDIPADQKTVTIADVSIIHESNSNVESCDDVIIINSENEADESSEPIQAVDTKQEPVMEQIGPVVVPCAASNATNFDISPLGSDSTVQSGQNEIEASHSTSNDLNVPVNKSNGSEEHNVSYGSIGSNDQQQVPDRPVINALQIQPHSYNPNENRNNALIGRPVINGQNAPKVPSHLRQPLTIDCSLTLSSFIRKNSTVNNRQPPIINNGIRINETVQGGSNNRIIAEQFPTLGNWVRSHNDENFRRLLPRIRHKSTKPNANKPTEGTVQVSSARKIPNALAHIGARKNGIGVKFRVEAERCQGYQDQQKDQPATQRSQQRLQQSAPDSTYQSLTSAASGSSSSVGLISSSTGPSVGSHVGPSAAAPTGFPAVSSTVTSTVPLIASSTPVANQPSYTRFCPPMSAASLYPTNYPMDIYGNSTFGFQPSICTYNNCQCHTQLHPAPLNGLHYGLPETLQNVRPDSTRFIPADIAKYSSLGAGPYTHPNVVDFERCRAMNAARSNGGRDLQSILLPSTANLPSSSQQPLSQQSISGYPTHNGQYNRITPDMVAAAAAAAVAAAASIGQQHNSLPSYNRQECGRGTGRVDLPAEEPSRLAKNPSSSTRERLTSPHAQANIFVGRGQDSQQNRSAAYNNLQNLVDTQRNRVEIESSYGPGSSFPRDVSAPSASSETSGYQASIATPSKNCPTPHLERINRIPNMLNAVHCSNCGRPGCAFKCLGCETAFYCDERCQARHWTVHGQKCPKKMPKLKKVI